MVVMVVILGLFTVFLSIVNGMITNSYYTHHRYNIQRAFMGGLTEGYYGESLEGAMDLFVKRFEMEAPVGFEYVIDIMNYEKSPKLWHVRVRGIDVNGIEIEVEKSMVEEVVHETVS